MLSYCIAIVCLLLALTGVVLQKTYQSVPAKEMRRRANARDEVATKLYRAVAYGASLELLLWSFITVMSAIGFILLARLAPVWLSFIAVAALLWLSLFLIPSSRVSPFGSRLTTLLTPFISAILSRLQPIFGRGALHLIQKPKAQPHTGVYERRDIVELLTKQQKQADNRVRDHELSLIQQTIELDERTVGEFIMHRGSHKALDADDTIGPVLIDEVHRAGLAYVPVVEPHNKHHIVGILPAERLGLDSSGTVRDFMETAVYYVNEDDSLREVLKAYGATNYPAYCVVDSRAKIVGIITIQDVLSQLLGDSVTSEAEDYSDLASVAKRYTPAKLEVASLEEQTEEATVTPPDSETEEISPQEETVVE